MKKLLNHCDYDQSRKSFTIKHNHERCVYLGIQVEICVKYSSFILNLKNWRKINKQRTSRIRRLVITASHVIQPSSIHQKLISHAQVVGPIEFPLFIMHPLLVVSLVPSLQIQLKVLLPAIIYMGKAICGVGSLNYDVNG